MNRFLATARIYRRPIGSHRAVVCLLVISGLSLLVVACLPVLVFLANQSSSFDLWPALVWLFASLVGLVAVVRGLARKIIIQRIVGARRYLGQIDLDNQHQNGSRVGVSILREEAKADRLGKLSAASLKAQVLEKGDGWWLYDATSIIHSDKGIPAAERCYTVFEVKLRQATPHLVFDSKSAKGRQFKSIYSDSQQLQGVLGAELDRLFATYSPKHHAIETLSFITPEVIEAMLATGDLDLEFIDNSLLCYGPFLPPDRLAGFRRRCLNLHAKVNDNLRLHQPKQAAAQPFGRRLLKSHRGQLGLGLSLVVFGGLISALGSLAYQFGEDGAVGLIIFGITIWIPGLVPLVSGLKVKQRNQRLEQEFLDSTSPSQV